MERANYENLDIFVGLDVHKKSWDIKIMTAHTSQKQIHKADASVDFLANYLKRKFPGANYHCVYEAGFCGFWIQEELQKSGISTQVVHAADVPTTDKEKRFKDDRIDSNKLALSLRSGQLTGIFIPPKEMQKDRSLVRQRYQFASDVRRYKNRIGSHLDFYGIHLDEIQVNKHWSKRYLLKLANFAKENQDIVLLGYIDKLQAERQFVLRSTRLVRNLSRSERYVNEAKLLMSIPGVGLLTTMVFLTEMGDLARFKSDDHYKSYIGLIPGIQASGENQKVGRMTKRGNTRVKTALILSAWMSIRNSAAMIKHYENYRNKGFGANKAIVKIAVKLALIMKAVLRNKSKYIEK